MPREVDKIIGAGQHLLRAARDLAPEFSQHNFVRPALHQGSAKRLFQLADLHGKGGLADRAILSRLAEMPMPGERLEVTQLLQRDHADKIALSEPIGNSIRPYLFGAGNSRLTRISKKGG